MRDLLTDRGILFLWATSPRMDFAMDCIKAWALHYRGVGFVWVKTKADGTPIGAQGVRPSIVKPLTEFVLCASPVATGRPLKLYDESVVQTVFAPRGEHSQKPEEMKIELFARRLRLGWDAWGNEVPEAA